MNSSSAQSTCSITSSDIVYISNMNQDGSCDTITLTGSAVYDSSISPGDTITLDLGDIGAVGTTYTIGTGGAGSSFTWKMPEEWVDTFPDYFKVQEMCGKYPAFKIAFEKFKQMYDLVEDDYEAKKGNKYVP